MERFTVLENNLVVRLSFAKDKSERHLRIFVHNEDGTEIYPPKFRRTELIISIADGRYVPDFASMSRSLHKSGLSMAMLDYGADILKLNYSLPREMDNHYAVVITHLQRWAFRYRARRTVAARYAKRSAYIEKLVDKHLIRDRVKRIVIHPDGRFWKAGQEPRLEYRSRIVSMGRRLTLGHLM